MDSKNKAFLPGYISLLEDSKAKTRYKEKLDTIGGLDPYEIVRNEWQDDVNLWPSVSSVHVAMYLLVTPSPYTGDDLVNYKSMDCYRNFLAGWVKEILVKAPNNNYRIVIAKVNHSQRLSDKPLIPWVISEKSGKIVAGHCNCMAGLGETCSHVAALLWAIESGVRLRDSMTVTQKEAYWVMPNAVKAVTYAPVKEISFIGKKRSQSILSSSSSPSPSPVPVTSSTSSFIFPTTTGSSATPPSSSSGPSVSNCTSQTTALLPPTDEEVDGFFESLGALSTKPAILSLIDPYSDNYIPKSMNEDLPMCLLNLLKPEYLKYSYRDLLQVAKQCKITVTSEQIEAAERETRSQSKSSLWFRMRSGRITSSVFKRVCHTDLATPSISLIMQICHPELTKFSNSATMWGCDHEKVAIDQYQSISKHSHQDFKVETSGLFINPDYPFIGASPDSLVLCLCCGEGVCEVKCPYCHKDTDSICEVAANDRQFCLAESDGRLQLKHDHAYYYQVQCQMFTTKRIYCDFVLWTEKEIHIERIYPDDNFWHTNVLDHVHAAILYNSYFT